MSPFERRRYRAYRSLLATLAILAVTLAAGSTAIAPTPQDPSHVKSIFGKLGLAQSEADHRRVLAVLAHLHD